MNYTNTQVFTYDETVILLDVIRNEIEQIKWVEDVLCAQNPTLKTLKSAYEKLLKFEMIIDLTETDDVVWKSIYDLQDKINIIYSRLELLESEQDDLK